MLLTVFISLVIIGIVILLYYIFTLKQFLWVRKGISRISYIDDEITQLNKEFSGNKKLLYIYTHRFDNFSDKNFYNFYDYLKIVTRNCESYIEKSRERRKLIKRLEKYNKKRQGGTICTK